MRPEEILQKAFHLSDNWECIEGETVQVYQYIPLAFLVFNGLQEIKEKLVDNPMYRALICHLAEDLVNKFVADHPGIGVGIGKELKEGGVAFIGDIDATMADVFVENDDTTMGIIEVIVEAYSKEKGTD